jgi:hypothetical protein
MQTFQPHFPKNSSAIVVIALRGLHVTGMLWVGSSQAPFSELDITFSGIAEEEKVARDYK